ncbi:MAG: hypothetical protein MK209_04245, partial [Planctomycetes bacterium]|nr:hypothetical protein [Planctomycetota bacterium]
MIHFRLLFSALALGLLAVPAVAQDGAVAVRAGKVITGPGQIIENGTVVVQNGRIVAIGGPDLEIPFDVLLHEHPDAVLFAGFHEAHTSNGMDRPNENVPVAPFLDVADSIDPVSSFFENELRSGVTALGVIPGNNTVIGGMGQIVAPRGMTVEQMALGEGMGMKIAIGPRFGWSRSAQMAELREAEEALIDALRRKGQELIDKRAADSDATSAGDESDSSDDDGDSNDNAGGFVRFGADYPGKGLISEEDLDDSQRGLVHILNGDMRLWLSCPSATDVAHGMRWASEHGFENVVYVVSADAHKAADMLAEANAMVALVGGLEAIEIDPVSG